MASEEKCRFKDEVYEHLARVGKALSSPKRLELLELLAQGPRTVEALAKEAGLGVANASKHLQVLRAAKLADAEKNGLFVTYRIGGDSVAAFLRSTRKLGEERLADMRDVARRYFEGREGLEPVDRIELLSRMKEGSVTVLDVRPSEEYAAGHLPGAISIPLGELEKKLSTLPRRRKIVAYCRGPYCVLAAKAVLMLRQKGFTAARFEEGIPDWKADGLPVVSGAA